MDTIVRSTLAEQAYQDLRQRILSGAWPAGYRLLPEELATTLAISPTPIKQALVRLDEDGLVAMEARRGAVVRRFTAEDVTSLYEARTLIELHALARGFEDGHITAGFVDALRVEQNRLLAHRALGSQAGLTDALAQDRAFHGRIVALAGNSLLTDWHQRVMVQTHTIRVYSLASYPLPRLDGEHAAIIAAVSAGDAAAAAAALRHHLTLSRNDILARLPGR